MENKVLIVAELGINHNGDVDIAREMIDVAKSAGCDFVKLQKRTIDKVYSKEELDRPRESLWGVTNREQKEGLEFDKRAYECIDSYCTSRGIPWFASPWDTDSVVFLRRFYPSFMKIPSALITQKELLEAVKVTGIPSILSTGMSTYSEVKEAVDFLGDNLEYILACTSSYPTKDEEMNLSFITLLKKQFPKHKIGFSNHSPSILFMSATVALGVEMIEFHMTLDRSMYGSDQSASIEKMGVFKVVDYIRGMEKAVGDGLWKVFPSEELVKKKLRK